jgi:hypothetical protein
MSPPATTKSSAPGRCHQEARPGPPRPKAPSKLLPSGASWRLARAKATTRAPTLRGGCSARPIKETGRVTAGQTQARREQLNWRSGPAPAGFVQRGLTDGDGPRSSTRKPRSLTSGRVICACLTRQASRGPPAAARRAEQGTGPSVPARSTRGGIVGRERHGGSKLMTTLTCGGLQSAETISAIAAAAR